ncbi:hypothetical protein HQ531_05075 [bacterium]|nr:hypothetical protein [bacterium]
MARYYVNLIALVNGDHEVHKEGCSHMPLTHNQKYLGNYLTCEEAIQEAQKWDSSALGCYYCSNTHHAKKRIF